MRYRETGTTAWRNHAFEGTGTGATITSLTKASTYEVQVRARSGEGAGEWSDSGRGATLYLSVTIADARAAEGDPLTFTVTLNRAVQDGLTVTPRFADGTATEGIDYTASTAALKFAGAAGETQTITVATVQDEVVEADETFTVSLGVSSASSWVVVGEPATGTIADDDGTVGGNATVTIADADAVEGDPLTFTVTSEPGGARRSDGDAGLHRRHGGRGHRLHRQYGGAHVHRHGRRDADIHGGDRAGRGRGGGRDFHGGL